VADVYERARPPYVDAAVEWIGERLRIGPGRRVLDLAAGTGKLTRQLVPLGAEIVAVEPGDGMRATLHRVLPEIEALPGTAEAIPLPDGAVDAVTVGQAFHWFRSGEALAEIHRVLRPGGGFAFLWNVWDEGDPVLQQVSALIDPLRSPAARGDGADWRERLDHSMFGELDQRTFRQHHPMATDALAEWVASTSAVATADLATQARVDARVRAIAGGESVDLTLTTEVVVADRV
jgi:ubiquinone/menaquinone biosynthesis C-methylase UbiE